MKATGMVRRIDRLGRLVIPKEIRKCLHIKEEDPMEIFIEDEKIILRKYNGYESIDRSLDDLITSIRNGDVNQNCEEMKEIKKKLFEISSLLEN